VLEVGEFIRHLDMVPSHAVATLDRMAVIDLVVTDLDGTLWDGGERIHQRTRAALDELEDRKVPLLVATGRRSRSAGDALARSGLAPPAVLLDGALGRDFADGRVFHRHAFTAPEATAVLEAFHAAGLSPCVYVERPGVDVVIGPQPSTCASHLTMLNGWAVPGDLEGTVASVPVYAFAICGRDPELLRPCARAIEESAAAASVTRDLLHGGSTLMVRPSGMSKWEGVLAFCAEQGLDARRVLAIGDGENDVELLTGASVSCVVSDGCDAALALADHIVEPACEGGWGRILDLV
jgi:hydroxymethylpyrimidine pyrophosphatase-like HAD family hydrolase